MLVHGIQVHPVNRRPLHVDLFVVRMTEELTVEVPLVGTGTAPAAEMGGTLVHPISTVKVRALPANLPDSLTYDLSSLTSYDVTITLADVAVPEGVTFATELTEVVARVLAPRVEEEVAPVAAEEGEEAEAGQAGEGGEAGRGRERPGATREGCVAGLGAAPARVDDRSDEAQAVRRQRPEPCQHVPLQRGALVGLERLELVRVVEAGDEREERLRRELVVEALGVRGRRPRTRRAAGGDRRLGPTRGRRGPARLPRLEARVQQRLVVHPVRVQRRSALEPRHERDPSVRREHAPDLPQRTVP